MVMLAGCGLPMYQPVSGPPTTAGPTLVDQVKEATKDTASLYAAATGANVTWVMGDPGDGYAAWTQWWCVYDQCVFRVTVRDGFATRDVLRHESGHVWCKTWLNDGSELCADQAAGLA